MGHGARANGPSSNRNVAAAFEIRSACQRVGYKPAPTVTDEYVVGPMDPGFRRYDEGGPESELALKT